MNLPTSDEVFLSFRKTNSNSESKIRNIKEETAWRAGIFAHRRFSGIMRQVYSGCCRELLLSANVLKPVLWIRIRTDFGRLDADPGWQKRPTKIEKNELFSYFKCWMFSLEGWGVFLHGGIGIKKTATFDFFKIWIFCPAVKCYNFWS